MGVKKVDVISRLKNIKNMREGFSMLRMLLYTKNQKGEVINPLGTFYNLTVPLKTVKGIINKAKRLNLLRNDIFRVEIYKVGRYGENLSLLSIYDNPNYKEQKGL